MTPLESHAQTVVSPRRPLLVDKLNRIATAWSELAPGQRFAEMSLEEFAEATGASLESRGELADSKTVMRALVGQRLTKETALKRMLNRVASAVRTDGRFGDDSELYRAMGYIPRSERRPRPTAAQKAAQSTLGRTGKPKRVFLPLMQRYKIIVAAWEQSGAGPSIGGLALEELKAAGEDLQNILIQLVQTHVSRRSLVGVKLNSDAETRALIKRVVASVVASPLYGDNSALYRAMGYVPADERRTRRTENRPEEPSAAAPHPMRKAETEKAETKFPSEARRHWKREDQNPEEGKALLSKPSSAMEGGAPAAPKTSKANAMDGMGANPVMPPREPVAPMEDQENRAHYQGQPDEYSSDSQCDS